MCSTRVSAETHLHACRAGFIVVDLVLLFLVAAFVISTLINFFCVLFDRRHRDKQDSIWARRTFLLLDCITCAVMIMSKHLPLDLPSLRYCALTALCSKRDLEYATSAFRLELGSQSMAV